MKVQRVPLQWVHATWPQVKKYIQDAAIHSKGEFTASQAHSKIADGTWVLYVAVMDSEVRGAATVETQQRMNDRVALVTALGGRGVVLEAFPQLCELLRVEGATVVEMAVRPSMARLMQRAGTRPKYMIHEVRLIPDTEV